MKISKEEVIYIAKLAKLQLTEEETEKMTQEFEGILSNFEAIKGVDLSEVQPQEIDKESKPLLRQDEARIFQDKKKLYKNTLDLRDGYIKVPKIIE